MDGAGQLRGLLLQLLRKAAMRRLLQQGIFHLLLQLIFYQIGEQHPLLGGVFSLHRHPQKEGAKILSQAVGPLQVAGGGTPEPPFPPRKGPVPLFHAVGRSLLLLSSRFLPFLYPAAKPQICSRASVRASAS